MSRFITTFITLAFFLILADNNKLVYIMSDNNNNNNNGNNESNLVIGQLVEATSLTLQLTRICASYIPSVSKCQKHDNNIYYTERCLECDAELGTQKFMAGSYQINSLGCDIKFHQNWDWSVYIRLDNLLDCEVIKQWKRVERKYNKHVDYYADTTLRVDVLPYLDYGQTIDQLLTNSKSGNKLLTLNYCIYGPNAPGGFYVKFYLQCVDRLGQATNSWEELKKNLFGSNPRNYYNGMLTLT